MPIVLNQRVPVRECLLLFGGPGSGKSNAVAHIVLNTPHVRHHIVDNELDSYLALFHEDPELNVILDRGVSLDPEDDAPVTIYQANARDWKDQLEKAQRASRACNPGDFYTFDVITPTWEAVQGWFTESIHNADLEDYFVQRRLEVEQANEEAKKEGGKIRKSFFVLDGQNDYGKVINPQYNLLYDTFLSCRGNSIIVAEEATISSENDTRATRNLFGPVKAKPKGQKRLGHVPRTVIYMQGDGEEWSFTVLKDRGRELVEDEVYGTDFARAYFGGVAKWKKGVWKGDD